MCWTRTEPLEDNLNPEMVGLERVTSGIDKDLLRAMIERHAALTQSPKARALLTDWPTTVAQFWKVAPHPSVEDATAEEQDLEIEVAALRAVQMETEAQAVSQSVNPSV